MIRAGVALHYLACQFVVGLVVLSALNQVGAAQTRSAADPLPEFWSFLDHPIHFEPSCFRGESFPTCDFDNPEAVRKLIGPYTLKVTYYDDQGQVAEKAAAPGRYAAVVEVHYSGRTTTRFVTLCRLGGTVGGTDTSAESLAVAGIDTQILKERGAELSQKDLQAFSLYQPFERAEAIWAAGLYDLTAMKKAGQALPKDTLLNLDRQWWVTFKRHYYGYDKVYTTAFVCPHPREGKAALTIREGSLVEAGVTAEGVAAIDRYCDTWVKETGNGLSLCVIRHCVVVIHQGYGVRTGRGAAAGSLFNKDSATELASATKFLGAILLSEFADQGLVGFDDPVDKYVLPLKGIKVERVPTIRELYLHTAGFDGHWGDRVNDMEELVADIYPTLKVGVKHKYQGVGLALGGKIMEMISGESMPRLYRKHLFDPLGCTHTEAELTSYGSVSTSMELARMGQMMLNGGAYGNMQFTSPKVIEQMKPIPGNDRFDPDKTIRWGVGIKMFDSEGLSEQAFGGSGACGSYLKIDPKYDLVIAMARDKEGDQFLKRRAGLCRAILDAIDKGK